MGFRADSSVRSNVLPCARRWRDRKPAIPDTVNGEHIWQRLRHARQYRLSANHHHQHHQARHAGEEGHSRAIRHQPHGPQVSGSVSARCSVSKRAPASDLQKPLCHRGSFDRSFPSREARIENPLYYRVFLHRTGALTASDCKSPCGTRVSFIRVGARAFSSTLTLVDRPPQRRLGQRPLGPLAPDLLEDPGMLGTARLQPRRHPGLEPRPRLRLPGPALRQPLGLDARAVPAVPERVLMSQGVFIARLPATLAFEPLQHWVSTVQSPVDRGRSQDSSGEGRVKAGQIGGFRGSNRGCSHFRPPVGIRRRLK